MPQKRDVPEEGVEGKLEPYKSREFCNSIGCTVQMEMNTHEKGSEAYNRLKDVCRSDCKYPRTAFIRWIGENGYRYRGGVDHEAVCTARTAYDYHQWLQERGVEIVRREP